MGHPSQLTEVDLLALIAADSWMMRALRSVAELELPDWWIVAGFVRAMYVVGHGSAGGYSWAALRRGTMATPEVWYRAP